MNEQQLQIKGLETNDYDIVTLEVMKMYANAPEIESKIELYFDEEDQWIIRQVIGNEEGKHKCHLLCTQRNKGIIRGFKTADAAINVIRDLEYTSFLTNIEDNF